MESRRGQNTGLWGMPFDNAIWQSIAHLGQKFFFPAGTIIRHNQYRGIFYIQKGRVCLSYFSGKGKEVKALYYNQNAIVNEARTFSVLTRTAPLSVSKTANSASSPEKSSRVLISSVHTRISSRTFSPPWERRCCSTIMP